MKTIGIVFSILTVFCILYFSYYFSTKTIELSKSEFEVELRNSKVSQTMYHYKLLYIKDDDIFLSKKEMTPFFNKWREIVFYTNLNHLSPVTEQEIRSELRE